MTAPDASSSDASPRGADRPRALGPVVAAATITILAALLIFQALQISRGAGFSVVGPGSIPLAVAAVLLLLGLVFLARTTIRPDPDLSNRAMEEERSTHWPTVGIVAAMLVVYALALNGVRFGSLVIPGLGYIPATGLFLPAVAWALGSRHLVRDVLIGFGVATVVFFGFTEYLGVRLPAGLLDLIL